MSISNQNGIFKKIMVPIDGSRYSLNATRLAGRLCAIHSSSLLILHVIDIQVEEQLCRLEPLKCEEIKLNMQEEAKGLVENMRQEVEQICKIVKTKVLKGVPHEVILDIAQEEKADLLVMGKLGRRGVRRILLGSVAERVLEFSKCPVLIVDSYE